MIRLIFLVVLLVLSGAGYAQRPGQYEVYSSKRQTLASGRWTGDTSFIPTAKTILIILSTRFDIKVGDSVVSYRVVEQGSSFYESSIGATVIRLKLGTDKENFIEAQLAFYDEGKVNHTGMLAIRGKDVSAAYRFHDMQVKAKKY